MRHVCALLALFAPAAALADAQGQRWYMLNKDAACEPLAEIHNSLSGLSGNWGPDDLLKVLREQYPDARLASLLDAADKKKPPSKTAAAPSAAHQKYLTPANAKTLTANDGQLAITLYNWELCSKLGILPDAADQWLTLPPDADDALAGGEEIPRANWFAVNDERLKEATNALKQKSFSELSESWAAFIAERRYMPEPDKHTFLVRGIRNDNAGAHKLVLRDGVLYVIFLSAGHDDHLSYAPLLVNLPEAPQAVAVLVQEGKP